MKNEECYIRIWFCLFLCLLKVNQIHAQSVDSANSTLSKTIRDLSGIVIESQYIFEGRVKHVETLREGHEIYDYVEIEPVKELKGDLGEEPVYIRTWGHGEYYDPITGKVKTAPIYSHGDNVVFKNAVNAICIFFVKDRQKRNGRKGFLYRRTDHLEPLINHDKMPVQNARGQFEFVSLSINSIKATPAELYSSIEILTGQEMKILNSQLGFDKIVPPK